MRNIDTMQRDIETLIESRLTPKQREQYDSMRGYYADRLARITKVAWVAEAVAEVERRQEARRERELQREEEFAALVKDRTFTATVRWFDKLRGEGMVYIAELGSSWAIYACNISGKRTWYAETACVYYDKGQEVEVQLDHRCRTRTFVIGVTPGTLDAEAWDHIKDQNLAFRCNDAGEAVTGLMAKGAKL